MQVLRVVYCNCVKFYHYQLICLGDVLTRNKDRRTDRQVWFLILYTHYNFICSLNYKKCMCIGNFTELLLSVQFHTMSLIELSACAKMIGMFGPCNISIYKPISSFFSSFLSSPFSCLSALILGLSFHVSSVRNCLRSQSSTFLYTSCAISPVNPDGHPL